MGRSAQAAGAPKTLHERIQTAVELYPCELLFVHRGRRAQQFRPRVHAHRLADLIDDFRPLQRLPAFQALEAELDEALKQFG